MKYIIGVDAGGTKTVAQSYDLSGIPLKEYIGKSGNVTVNFNDAINNILNCIDNLLKLTFGDCIFICVGIAGVETGNLKDTVQKILEKKYQIKIKVINDAVLSLYAGLKGQDGILLIAGTGSICYGKKGEEFFRCGGWGHLINDDGGGYSLVMKAIKNCMFLFDNKKDSLLLQEFFKELNINNVNELIKFIYNSNKSQIAALFPIIDGSANNGDEEALYVLEWGAKALVKLLNTMCMVNEFNNPFVVLNGSVIRKSNNVKKYFFEYIDYNKFIFSEDSFNPTIGAFHILDENK